MGSDHYPIIITVIGSGRREEKRKGDTGRWIYQKANWAEFI